MLAKCQSMRQKQKGVRQKMGRKAKWPNGCHRLNVCQSFRRADWTLSQPRRGEIFIAYAFPYEPSAPSGATSFLGSISVKYVAPTELGSFLWGWFL